MPDRFAKEARAVAGDAQDEARASGSSTVEAEQLLLALARDGTSLAGDVLGVSGLDDATIRRALDEEFGRALMAVGVSRDALGPGRAAQPYDATVTPGWRNGQTRSP